MAKNELQFNNTYKSGRMSFIVFGEGKSFTAVCLEFDLIAKADTMTEAINEINDAAKVWLENIIENKLSEELLNKSAPKKYWDMQKKFVQAPKKRKRTSKLLKTSIIHEYTPQNYFFA